MTHSSFLSTRHFGSLDGIRCFSIVAVIWHHTDHAWVGMRWAGLGFLGVDMFFVLSGFLIVTLLLRERDRRGNISLKKFYVRRTLRIFPLYYGLILLLTIASLVFRPGDPDTQVLLFGLPFYLAYVSNFITVHANNLAVTWSLATEEQFYLVWPALEKLIRGKRIYLLIGLVLLFNQMINFGLFDPWLNAWYGAHHPEVFDATFTPIALGVLLAHLLHAPTSFARLAPILRRPSVHLILLLVLLVTAPQDISGLSRLSIQLVMMLLLGSVVVREDHELSGILRFKLFVRFGVVSYGMYLFHLLVRHGCDLVLKKLDLQAVPALGFVFVCLVTWLVAEASFRLYESPFLKLKRRFAV